MESVAPRMPAKEDAGSKARLLAFIDSFRAMVEHNQLDQVASVFGIRDLKVGGLAGGLSDASPVTPEEPRLLPDPRIRSYVEKSLKRQERMYRVCFGEKLVKNADYQVFRTNIIEQAMQAHKKGLNYFVIVLGDDVLGPGNGMSPLTVLSALREQGVVVEDVVKSLPKTSVEGVLSQIDAPVETSYGFWTADSSEPDKSLVAVPGENVRKRQTATQGCLEHALFILEHHLRKKGKLPNEEVSTLCEFPEGAMILDAKKENVVNNYRARFVTKGGTIRLVVQFATTRDKAISHRHVVRVQESKKL